MFSGDMVYWSDLVCPVSVLVSLTENIVVCCEKILVLILVMQLLPVSHKPLIECFDICNWHWWLVASRPGLTATTALPEVSFVFTKVFPWAGSAVRVSSVPAGNHLFVVLLLCATCCLPSMFVLPQKHASVGFTGLPPGRTSSCYWPVLRWVGHCLLSRQVSSSSRKPWCSNHWCVTSPLAKGWQHQCHLQLQMHSHLEVASTVVVRSICISAVLAHVSEWQIQMTASCWYGELFTLTQLQNIGIVCTVFKWHPDKGNTTVLSHQLGISLPLEINSRPRQKLH